MHWMTSALAGCPAGLLEERIEAVYKQAPGYSEKAVSLFVLDLGPPQDLPDALRGEAWLFVQLPLSMLRQELRSVESRAIFGDSFQLATAGLGDLPADTLIPGAPPRSIASPCSLQAALLASLTLLHAGARPIQVLSMQAYMAVSNTHDPWLKWCSLHLGSCTPNFQVPGDGGFSSLRKDGHR